MKKGEIFERVKISKKEYDYIKKIEKTVTSTKVYQRVQFIKLIHKGWKYSAIAEFLNVTNDTITDWVNIYKKTGVSGLLKLKYKGKIPLLSEEQLIELRAKRSTFKVAKEARKYIKDNYGVDYNPTYIHELLKKNFFYHLKEQN